MNKFYEINIVLQWIVAVSMLFAMLLILHFWIGLMSESIFGFLLIFIIAPVFQFLTAPFFRTDESHRYSLHQWEHHFPGSNDPIQH